MTTLSKLFILLITASSCVAQTVQLTNTFINRCPAPISLVIGGNITGTIPAGGTVNTNVGFNTGGFFYTDANGGNANGTGTTRVGFFIQVLRISLFFSYLNSNFGGPIGFVPLVLLHRQGPESLQHSHQCNSE